ncbi:ScbA/BarX family gamma-butyrolactone biosynthesis protein [Streptomyces sp. NPDC005899]|uniref:ScbA/BarX family gamma-butyrolactone biosynthesis protein n=1 Tax=Streptomyces sp. NPDC005899 TaxID=3155716 RepID=UPI0033D031E6
MPDVHGGRQDRSRIAGRVPQELVHKHDPAEVLLTDWTTHGGNLHTVRARWPRRHSFYQPHQGHFDPLLLVETVRQTLPLLSHVAYGVPFGSHLVWDDFTFEVEPQAMLIPEARADVVLEAACTDVRTRKGCLASMTMHLEVRLNGRHAGSARTRFTNHSPAVYRRLRGQRDLAETYRRALPPQPPLPPATVGHHRDENVVLAGTGRADRWQLRADLGHPVLFDHLVDHAPGMLLLEAVRQAAHVYSPVADCVVTGMSVSFEGWVELDAPAWVSVTPTYGDALRAVIEQEGGTCLAAEVAVGSVPAPTAEHPAVRDGADLQLSSRLGISPGPTEVLCPGSAEMA